MNLLTLTVKLPLLFARSAFPFAPLFTCLNLFVDASLNLLRIGCGSLRLLPIRHTHGFGFPFADALSHKGWAVGFPNIVALDEEVQDAHIPTVIIQFQVFALQAVEQAWTHIPVTLKGQTRTIVNLIFVAPDFAISRLH